jgi:multiple sugar transport system substrate-binding protein
MRSLRRPLVLVAIFFVLPCIAILAGGQTEGAKGGVVTVTLMRDAAEMPDEVIAAFEAGNPDVKVNKVENDFTKLMTMIAGGNPPDMFRVNAIGLPYWIRKNMLRDITGDLSKAIDMNDLFPVNNMYRFDGKTQGVGPYYGLLKDWSVDYMYYYNRDALDEAGVAYPSDDTPLNFADFTNLINKVTVYKGGKVERYGFGFTDDEFNGYFLTMLASKGKWLFTKDGKKLNIDDPDVRFLFKWWFDEAKIHHAMHNPLDPAPDWDGPLFQAGRVAVQWDGYWFGPIVNEAKAVSPDRVGFAPAPIYGTKRVDATGGGTGYVIYKNTKQFPATWKYWSYYMLKDEAVARAKSGWGLPAFKSLLKDCPQETAFDKYRLAQVNKELPYQVILQFPPYLRETALISAYGQQMEPALKGALDFDTALKNMADQINGIIKQEMEAK